MITKEQKHSLIMYQTNTLIWKILIYSYLKYIWKIQYSNKVNQWGFKEIQKGKISLKTFRQSVYLKEKYIVAKSIDKDLKNCKEKKFKKKEKNTSLERESQDLQQQNDEKRNYEIYKGYRNISKNESTQR